MNENETTNQDSSTDTPEPVQTPAATPDNVGGEAPKSRSRMLGYIAAGLVVVIMLLGVLYLLEKEGRSSTGLFDSILEQQAATRVVATVNGTELLSSELTTSVRQFSQAAAAQGVDVTTPDAQAEIRSQALEVLINTELLRQQAQAEGIEVTEAEAAERLATIEAEIGGPDALAERMMALGIEPDQIQADIQDEIMIQRLLDSVFASNDLAASEEEIAAVYEQAGGADGGLPPIDEVSEQIAAQVVSSKEQQVVDEYISNLRAEAEIEFAAE